ncbi:cyclase family protein [Halorubrum lacusprofundi]|uniref:Cyclase family protein n=1 Tax=Halorubrum lacusprofundi (strain ATCC 49239 / DSM 5036 / JCM 8891 / ACAM 34) TaxID=416348 RepID=B9LMM1_HALLT|nr:cyclase family protein [Halorubrum lacusprofundi]ACM56609.1 cyclase family protein [Halorubrum lacusprofundi ATCC 49239]MCG1005125.1 cyclase family protein [Halorubrum lacusprofundi]
MFRDLSRPIETGMPTYPGDPDVTLAPDATHEEDGYATSELRTGTHAGTHVDAPRHTLPEGESIDERAVGEFAFDARLVDLRPLEPREAITAEELPEPNVLDPAVDLLVFRTGWAAHWGTDRYRDHPYLTAGAARRCQKLGVGVGLDTFGPDPTPPGSAKTTGPSRETEPEGTPAHDALLSDSLPIVENLCGLDGLPAGFRLYAFPLRLRGADGSPVRAVAEWEG